MEVILTPVANWRVSTIMLAMASETYPMVAHLRPQGPQGAKYDVQIQDQDEAKKLQGILAALEEHRISLKQIPELLAQAHLALVD